jgi:hypothetical protein
MLHALRIRSLYSRQTTKDGDIKEALDDNDEMNFFDGYDRFDENAFISQSSVALRESESYANGFALESYGREWLLEQCDQHVKIHMPQSGFTGSQLSANVLDVLRSSESGWFLL